MRTRAIVSGAVLSCAIVSGGWLVQRGFVTGSRGASAKFDGSRLYDQVLKLVRDGYVDSATASDVYRKSVDGLLLELGDPHTVYLTDTRLNRLNETTTGKYAGVGIQIDVRDGWITVVTPLPDSPAEEAGIRTGDRIAEIDGKSTHRWTPDEASKALRGEPGTKVTLGIERFGMAAHIPFTINRRAIHVRSVQHAMMLRDGVGYVDLLTFSDSAAGELRHEIDSLRGVGMKSLLLDLRGDPGGLLDEGVDVSELFLDAGQDIVSMRGRSADVTHDYRDRAAQNWPDLLLGVLVDSGSASAAEIVAGALQDHDRAVVIGTTTYGKGSAQQVFPVDGGGLKLTIAKWFTPSGRSINKSHGPIDPDSAKAKKLSAPTFKTDAGRAVEGGGGIKPDEVVSDSLGAVAIVALNRAVGTHANDFRDVVTSYAMSFKAKGGISSPDFSVTAPMRQEFLRQLAARKVTIDSTTARITGSLLDRLLAAQIERYVFGTTAEFSRALREDRTVQRGIAILSGSKTQKEAIERAK